MPTARPDYGIDAPGTVRNLALAGAVGFAAWLGSLLAFWPGNIVAGTGLACGLAFTGTALWMVYVSRVGKLKDRERRLNLVPWTGAEHVLDVGCGRGLMLVAAARRLTTGRAVGIDIWQAEDLSGNRPEATLENAAREGVADRVEVKTADMRELPFPDASFDVAVSCAAIHNLYAAADRGRAVREIVRVLKPGGRAVIADIRHAGEYATAFTEAGCRSVRRAGSPVLSLLAAVVTFGSVRPATLVVEK